MTVDQEIRSWLENDVRPYLKMLLEFDDRTLYEHVTKDLKIILPSIRKLNYGDHD